MYEDMTPERLKEDIKAGLRLETDRREGSFADDMAGPVAVELSKVYGSLNAVEPIVWVDETSGRYLDDAAAEMGLEPRKQGVKAAVTLTVTAAEGYVVKAGTRFATADGLYFATLGEAAVPASGSVELPAEAERTGSAYNVSPGEIKYQFENDSRIKSVANARAAEGGADPESDASLYARIVAGRQKPSTSGNVYDYERWAKETPGVGFAKCVPRWPQRGGVKVLVADEQRQPVDGAIVADCAAHIEGVRPVGANVTVKSVEPLKISVAADVAIDQSVTLEQVAKAFSEALDAYLLTLAFVKYEVPYNKIGALLMGVGGVTDYTGLRVNGASANVLVGEDQVPVVGEVALT